MESKEKTKEHPSFWPQSVTHTITHNDEELMKTWIVYSGFNFVEMTHGLRNFDQTLWLTNLFFVEMTLGLHGFN